MLKVHYFHPKGRVAVLPRVDGGIEVPGADLTVDSVGRDVLRVAERGAIDAFIVGNERVIVKRGEHDTSTGIFLQLPGDLHHKPTVPVHVTESVPSTPLTVVGAFRPNVAGEVVYIAVRGAPMLTEKGVDAEESGSADDLSFVVLGEKQGELRRLTMATFYGKDPKTWSDGSLRHLNSRFVSTWANGITSIIWLDPSSGLITVLEYTPEGRLTREFEVSLLHAKRPWSRATPYMELKDSEFAHVRVSLSNGGRYLLVQDDKGARPAEDTIRTVFHIVDLHNYGRRFLTFHPPNVLPADAPFMHVDGRMTEAGVLVFSIARWKGTPATFLMMDPPGSLFAIDVDAAIAAASDLGDDALLVMERSSERRKGSPDLDEPEYYKLLLRRRGKEDVRVHARDIPYRPWKHYP